MLPCLSLGHISFLHALQFGPLRLNAHFSFPSVMVASKFLDDFYCRNSFFAAAGGMTTAELNALEVRFCFLMDFRLAVSVEEYDACVGTLLAGVCFCCG